MATEKEQLIARITEMEDRYDELTTVLGELDMAIQSYLDFKEDLGILRNYMESGQWKKDFEADEAGEVPADLKREVLSQGRALRLPGGCRQDSGLRQEDI